MIHHHHMRIALVLCQILLIGCSSVLGTFHTVVLCFVREAETPSHIELFSKDAAEVGVDCFVSEQLIIGSGCPPCTDIVLKTADILTARSASSQSGNLAPTELFGKGQVMPKMCFRPVTGSDDSNLAWTTARVEHTSEMVSRIIVMRV
jgi:hypothetical protein